MVVRTQSDGRVVIGLYIGTRNARREFPKRNATIELHLGDVQILCALAPEFWHGRPEIRDQRLCDWLESMLFHRRSCRIPVPLLMLSAGGNVYRLQPLQVQPSSIGNESMAPGAPPAKASEKQSPCGGAVCRMRSFIHCSVNSAPPFRSPESPA
jgi:hypothetical protein